MWDNSSARYYLHHMCAAMILILYPLFWQEELIKHRIPPHSGFEEFYRQNKTVSRPWGCFHILPNYSRSCIISLGYHTGHMLHCYNMRNEEFAKHVERNFVS